MMLRYVKIERTALRIMKEKDFMSHKKKLNLKLIVF